ncbi:hypothetical protein C8R46DRAFT_1069808 [Mycena filopes]|nr:hypothetical protein C8R46DRAFT_1069808 [Mycena filopes]
MEDDDVFLDLDSVFPEEARPPTPEATVAVYERQNAQAADWTQLRIRLVGAHPLWGHHLVCVVLDRTPALYTDRCVLELGAGGGLPGLVAALNGAKRVLLTDYPDAELIANLEHNVEENTSASMRDRVAVKGYIWGQPVQPLLDGLPSEGFRLSHHVR